MLFEIPDCKIRHDDVLQKVYIEDSAVSMKKACSIPRSKDNSCKMASFDVIDRTLAIYGSDVPTSVQEGKSVILGLLQQSQARSENVKSVQFLENFGLNNSETARANALRYTGLVVSLTPEFKLTPADAVWMNGLYNESTQMFGVSEPGNFVGLSSKNLKPGDSHGLAGVFQQTSQDELTGEIESRNFVIVNTSAADTARNMSNTWTRDGYFVRDAYENAITEKFVGVASQCADCSSQKSDCGCPTATVQEAEESNIHDNLRAFTENKLVKLSRKMTKLPAENSPQASNQFIRGKNCVHYLNGAVVASESGALCMVSPLHGFVRFKKTSERVFYPSHLLSSDRYVDVTKLNSKQQKSIFERAVWPSHTTCNSFALRKPIPNWSAALPTPQDVYRMHKANFTLDTEVHRCLPTRAILAMTPLSDAVESQRIPPHVKQNKVQLADTDALCAKLLSLRGNQDFPILNPAFYNKSKPNVLEIPREVAEKLAKM